MAGEKGWGKSVLGWFVVEDNAKPGEAAAPAQAASVEDLLSRYGAAGGSSQPGAAAAPGVELKGELPKLQGGQLELAKIYAAAGLTSEEQDRIGKAQELLKTLPVETPVAVKKQIVEASLKAFGYPIKDLIEAGVQEIEALESFIQRQGRETQQLLTESSARIEKLNQEIAGLRQKMQAAIDDQQAATRACNQAKLSVQEVLEFFGMEAVAQIVKDSPKLHEPS